MLEIGVIGCGNAGGQIANLSNKELNVDAIAINSSENDLATLPDSLTKILITDGQSEKGHGSGKDRAKAKQFLKDKILQLLKSEEFISFMDRDVVFVVSSCGGGTGSGISPILSELLRKRFDGVKIVTIGILPTLKEAALNQTNAAEYLKELYESSEDVSYMLYDNNSYTGMPTYQLLPTVNETIVRDISVIMGKYQTQTELESIDENDMKDIISASGRIVVAGLYDVKEKDLEDTSIDELLVKALKESSHAELQRDKKIKDLGIITNLSQKIYDKHDKSLPIVKEFIGKPDIDFIHEVVNIDNSMPNNAILVLGGLSPITDRMMAIKDEVDEFIAEKKKKESNNNALDILSQIDTGAAKEIRKNDKVQSADSDEIDVEDIFSRFNI